MDWDDKETPALWALFYNLGAGDRRGKGRRVIRVHEREEVALDLLLRSIDELRQEKVVHRASAEHLAAIAALAGKAKSRAAGAAADLAVNGIRDVIERRWNTIGAELSQHVLSYSYRRGDILKAIPHLASSSEFLDAICDALEEGDLPYLGSDVNLGAIAIPTTNQLRRLLDHSDRGQGNELAYIATHAKGDAEGWSSWLTLFCILRLHPDLAGDGPVIKPCEVSSSHDGLIRNAFDTIWARASGDTQVRAVAQLVIDLDGALRDATPDIRTVYAARLSSVIGEDDGLRRAAIEALLGAAGGRRHDLAIYAVTELVDSDDQDFLAELFNHPDRRIQYQARQVAAAISDEFEDGFVWQKPKRLGIANGLFQLTHAQHKEDGVPQTWLGDSLVERMIEHAALALETEFAREYPDHHGAGEEKLMERFFTKLSDRFDALDRGMLETARARGATTRTSVRIRYRTVDKSEEGGPGIARSGEATVPRFSADVCLIVDPILGGKSLGRRVTLVQAKRLYHRDRESDGKGWNHSYVLDPQQTSYLLRQTGSSVYLFQGPGLASRGLPVLPTQLVSDLAHNQSPSGGVIAADIVGLASRSFADWFTYDLLALRIGDPHATLVAKAERRPGSTPYDLFRYGTVEVEVRAGEPVKGPDDL